MCNKEADELRKRYNEMTRHLTTQEVAQIEISGPLSDDSFVRLRQEAYRAWLAASSGVIYSASPKGLTHHPA